MTDYIATDDDLPSIFWREPESPGTDEDHGAKPLKERSRAVAVSVHYPEIKIPRRVQQRRDAALRAEREVSLHERKIFIKLSKKLQMWDWLCSMLEPDVVVKIRNQAELGFVTQLYAKFFRYTPYKLKWVTRKQYDWLKYIASQYLKVPNEQA